MGLRAVVGKCMMDADAAVPSRLLEETTRSIDESVAIAKRWHGRADGRLRAAFAPRFAVSCSRELLEAVAQLADRASARHSHARLRESRRDRADQVADRPQEHRLPRRHRPDLAAPLPRALRVGRRRRAVADGRARRQGAALPRIEPEARLRPRAGGRDAREGHLGVARRRRRRLQQPSRHVRGDAAGGGAAIRASPARRADRARRRDDGDARRRAGARPRCARSAASRPASAPT